MKHLTLALIGVSVLATALLGAGGAAKADLRDAAGFYGNSAQTTARHIDLRSAGKGRISETDTYQTSEPLATVLTRYFRRYQPEPGQHKPGQCVILKQANNYLAVQETVLVTLCPSGSGTLVVVYRNLYLET